MTTAKPSNDATAITRNLHDGLDYRPDWRNAVVEQYLVRYSEKPCSDTARNILEAERDVVIRQVFRFRIGMTCVIPEAVRYALSCQQCNGSNGMASMIRAMVMADVRCDEIAAALHTNRTNIVVFTRLFYDIERFLGCEAWLHALVFGPRDEGRPDTTSVRERRWLAAAFTGGWEGLQKILFHRQPATTEDIKTLRLEIQEALGTRALEYALSLKHGGTSADQEDLSRFLMTQQFNGNQPGDESANAKEMEFCQLLVQNAYDKSLEEPDNEDFAMFRPAAIDQVLAEAESRQPARLCG